MHFLETQSIRRQVVVAAILLLLPLTGAIFWAARTTVREREVELSSQASSISATAAAYLNQYLNGLDVFASALSRHPDVRALRGEESGRLFAELLKEQPLILNILLTLQDGTPRASGLGPVQGVGAVQSLPYVTQVFETGRPTVSSMEIGVVSHRPRIVLAYPVRSAAGAIVAVLGIGINLERLQTVFASIPLPGGSVIALWDSSNRMLARSLEPERFIGTTQTDFFGFGGDLRKVPATRTGTGLDGITRIIGNTIVERGPWLLSVGIPRSEAMARALPVWRRNVLIGAGGILGTLLLLLGLAHKVAGQLGRLRSAAQRIASGDLTPPERESAANLELDELQNAFITMAQNLREARDALDRQFDQERKMREMLQSLQRQVVRQERLTAVGLLVSGVAHELNNPLQAILGTAELLERHSELSPHALEEIAFMKTQSGRAREIIRNLSRFSSQQTGPPSFLNLHHVIDEVVQLRRRDLAVSAITLEIESSSSRAVYSNFTELEQVILNFVINAQQSIEASGRPNGRIVIRLFDVAKRVRLEVQDNGSGVSAADESKLFQPFFTTKPVGKGTGLGLSVSYGIIDSNGGSIGYHHNDWGGATFFFELPSADAAPTVPDSPTGTSAAPPQNVFG